MSNVLDENVVILKFDNSDFKKNTEDSIKSLDKLKTSLNDKTGADGLERLGTAAKTIDLSGIGKSIDTINKRFSLFGIAGMSAINKLTGAAIDSVKNIVTAIPRQMVTGGWSRALNIENAKFLIEGLGFAWDQTSEKYKKGMKTVYEAVDNAVTGTRYALDEAAVVASQLMSSGVKNMDDLENSLKAVSGFASVANREYSEIGLIFSQVAGQGRMMGQDLLQLQQKGIGAAAEIKNYLNANKEVAKQAIDTAIAQGNQVKKMEEIRKHAQLTEADVREMVSAGAISFDIMSNSFLHFFDQAEKANDTYTGSLANLKSALNRIGQTIEEIKLSNLTKLFNALIPVVKKAKEFIDPLSKSLGAVSTKITDFFINGIINPVGEMIGVDPANLFHGFGNAVKEAGKETDTTGGKVRDLTNKIRVSKREWKAAIDIWTKGTYGNGQARADAIRKLGMSYEHVQGIINNFYKNDFNWEKTRKGYIVGSKKRKKSLNEEAEATEELAKAEQNQNEQLSAIGKVVKIVANVIKTVKNTLVGVKNLVVAFWRVIKPLVSTLGGGLLSILLKISDIMYSISEKFKNFAKLISGGKDEVDKASRKFPSLTSAFLAFGNACKWVSGVFKTAFDVVKRLFVAIGDRGFFKKVVGSFALLGKTIYSKVVSGLVKIKDGFKDVFDRFKGNNAIQSIASAFGKIATGISNFITALTSGKKISGSFMSVLGSVANKILSMFSPVLNWLVDTFFSAIQTIINFFEALGKSPGIQALKETLSELVDSLFETEKPLGKLVSGMRELQSASSGGGMTKSVGVFSNMAKGLSDFITSVANGEGPLEAFFFMLKRVKGLFSVQGILSYIKTTIGYNTGKGLGYMVNSLGDLISNVKKWLIDIGALDKVVKAATVVLGGLEYIGKLIKKIDINKLLNKVVNAPWEKIAKVTLSFAGALSMIKMALDMGKVARSAAGMFANIGNAFKSFGTIADTIKTSIRMKSFETLSISIAILIGSIVALAMVPVDRVKPALAAVGIILATLTGIMLAMTSSRFDAAKLHAIGIAFAGVGVSVMLIATSMMMLSKLKAGELIKAGVTIGAFMVLIGIISSRAKEMAGTGAAFMGLAVALNILVGAIWAFALMPYAVLLKGGSAIFGFMVMLASAAKIADSSNPGGFIAMAVAIGILVPAVLLMSLIPISNLVRGGAAMVALILSLGKAAQIADGKGFGSLDKVAIVMGVLAASCLVLSLIKPTRLVASGAAICAMLISLGEAAKISNGAKFTSLLGIIVLLGALVGAIVALDRLAPDRAVKIALSLSAVVVSIGGIIAIFSKLNIGPKDSAKAALAIDAALGIIVGGIGGIIAILGAIEKGCDKLAGSEGATKRFMKDGLGMLKIIREGFDIMFSTNDKNKKADPSIQSFVDMIEGVNKLLGTVKKMEVKDLEKFGKLAKAMNDLGQANMEDSIAKMLGGGSMDIGVQINNFAGKLVDFVDKVKEIDKGDLAQAQLAADIFGTFAHGAAEMPAQGGLAVFGSFKSLTWFGLQMTSFAGTLPGFISAMDKVPKEKLAGLVAQGKFENSKLGYIMNLVRDLNTLQGELNASAGLDQLKTGNTTLSEFANDISGTEGFAQGINAFITEVNAIPKEKLAALFADGKYENSKFGYIAKLVRSLNNLQGELNASGGLKQFKSGNTTLGEFANDLSGYTGFGTNFAKFIQEISVPGMDLLHLELAQEKIEPIAGVVRTLAKAGKQIPPSGGVDQFFEGTKDIGTFGSQMAQFAIGFDSLYNTLKGIEITDPEGFLSKIQTIADASVALSDIDPPTTGFFEALSTWAQFKLGAGGINALLGIIKQVGSATIPDDIETRAQDVADAAESLSSIKPPSEGFIDALKNWALAKIDSGGLNSLVETINSVSDAGNAIDTSGVAKFATATSTIKTSVQGIKSLGSIPTAANLATLAKNVKSFVDKMGGLKTSNIVKNAEATVRAADKLKELDGATDGVSTAASQMSTSGKTIASSLSKGITSGAKGIATAAKGLVTSARNAINTNGLHNAGYQLANGFASGMRSCQSQVEAAAEAMERAAERAVKAKAKIKSPSRVFMELGGYIGEGFVIGLSAYNAKVYRAGNKMASESVQAANDAMASLELYGNPTITPVLDLSQIEKGVGDINAMVSQAQAVSVNANVNSAVSSYATPWLVGDLLDKLNDISSKSLDVTVKNDDTMGTTNYFTFNVDGAENPEQFANRFVRQLELDMRTR